MSGLDYDMLKAKAYYGFVTVTDRWLKFLEAQNGDLLIYKSDNIEWSISELYDHLLKVANTYQLYHFRRCLQAPLLKKGGKNLLGTIIFDWHYLPFFKLQFETFPSSIRGNFAPENKPKELILEEFHEFIRAVKNMKPLLEKSKPDNKQHHPMFGWLNAAEWFYLIEIHFRHHERQKKKLKNLCHAYVLS